MKRYFFLPLVLILSTSVMGGPCDVGLKSKDMGIGAVVASCNNTGTFSIGGLYQGEWEKLSYFYPNAWSGTFLSIKVNERIYSNSHNPDSEILMDPYVIKYPTVTGNKILTQWLLPENLLVEEIIELSKNVSRIRVKVTNKNEKEFMVGVRLHIDTMLGDNDGAPIYIPGDGLKIREKEYSNLNFRYWKAYNRQENPWIVTTGFLAGDEFTYPDRLIVANWKRSMHSAWDYKVQNESILGDSAIILYYNERPLPPAQSIEVVTGYGIGEEILPGKKRFGIGEIITDKVTAVYCPGEEAEVSVDVFSGITGNDGILNIEILDGERILYQDSENTGFIPRNSMKTFRFRFEIPKKTVSLRVIAKLVKEDRVIDEKETKIISDYSVCEVKGNFLIFIPFLIFLILAVFSFYLHSMRSLKENLRIEKVKENDTVRITVVNETKRSLENCVIEDRIPEGAEVSVSTIGVLRKRNKLILNLGELPAGGKAIMEYRIKDIDVLPKAILRCNGIELESE